MEKRLVSLDFARGWGISFVVIFHAVVLYALQGTQQARTAIPLHIQILLAPFIILGTWASVFALISGTSLTLSFYRQALTKKINLNRQLKNSVIRSFMLLFFHFLYIYCFIHPILNIFDEPQKSFFVGSIQNEAWSVPSTSILYVSSALSMLAFADLFVTITLFFLLRKDGISKPKRNFTILAIIATVIVLSGTAIQNLLTPIMLERYLAGERFLPLILTWMVGRYHCIFPFVGFAFYGALIGMALAYELPFKKIARIGYGVGLSYLVIFLISIIFIGLPDLNGPVQSFGFYTLNMGLESCLFTFVIGKLDFSGDAATHQKYARWTLFVRRWGLISLSAFLMEGIIASSFALLFNTLFPGVLKQSWFVIIIWLPCLMYLWEKFLEWWQTVDFKFSTEWIIAYISASKSKKKQVDMKNLMHVGEWLFQPAGLTFPFIKEPKKNGNVKKEPSTQEESKKNENLKKEPPIQGKN